MTEPTPIPSTGTNRRSLAWKLTLLLIPLLTAAGLFALRQAQVRQLASRDLPALGQAPSFALTNQFGEPFGSSDLEGKIWIADFIFTNCRGPCPLISSRMADLQKPLRETGVNLVTFTVDPANDTPAVLRDYAQRLEADPARWTFLTGPEAAIYNISRHGFKLALDPGTTEGPVHTTRLVLVDRKGTVRGYYDALAPDTVTKLLADASQLLREQPGAAN